MGIRLRMRWRRSAACVGFHRPWQKELVCIIPPSFTVMLGPRGAAHRPGRLQRASCVADQVSTGGYLGLRAPDPHEKGAPHTAYWTRRPDCA